jgi:hypothetical protein
LAFEGTSNAVLLHLTTLLSGDAAQIAGRHWAFAEFAVNSANAAQ